jgi:8-oxo-dGTP diphosphatase
LSLYLVRHAKALKRSRWSGADRMRPIGRSGHAQARQIAARLTSRPVERVISSPYLRCRQTLEPLAATLGLPGGRRADGQGAGPPV